MLSVDYKPQSPGMTFVRVGERLTYGVKAA